MFNSAVHSRVSAHGANSSFTLPEASTGVVLDSSRAPLYVVRFPIAVTDAQLARIFVQFQEVLRRRQVIGVVCDASHSSLSPVQRKQVALEMGREGRHYARWVAGWALIVQSTVARGTLTALTWIAAPPFELKVFGEPMGAEAWAAERLRHVSSNGGTG